MARGLRFRTLAAVLAAGSIAAAAFPAAGSALGTLKLVIAGSGTGQVDWFDLSQPPLRHCPPDCSQTVAVTTAGSARGFSLRAVPTGTSTFEGWDVEPGGAGVSDLADDPCRLDTFCVVIVEALLDDPARRMFTSVTVTARFAAQKVTAPPPTSPAPPPTSPAPPPTAAAPPMIVPPPSTEPDSAFLCYSKYQVDPGVWPAPDAAALSALGYWRPYAIRGALSATRLGAYSLVCNPSAGTTVVASTFLDDGGDVLTDIANPQLGLYPLATS